MVADGERRTRSAKAIAVAREQLDEEEMELLDEAYSELSELLEKGTEGEVEEAWVHVEALQDMVVGVSERRNHE